MNWEAIGAIGAIGEIIFTYGCHRNDDGTTRKPLGSV